MLQEKAYAKINLALDILRKRDDGYHEVDMIMQTVSLHDTLKFFETANANIRLTITGANLDCGKNNLVYKAASLFRNETGITAGVEIELDKKIPMEAGLAGGSADAAATLRGLNRLWQVGLTNGQLQQLSAKIGSDVAFCISGGTARATGRGELITGLPDMPCCQLLIFKPDFGISTAWAYNSYAERAGQVKHPEIPEMIEAIRTGSVEAVCSKMGNVLEIVSTDKYPEIARIKAALLEQGAAGAMMSGSGTAVFGVFSDGRDIRTAASVLSSTFSGQIFLCRTQIQV